MDTLFPLWWFDLLFTLFWTSLALGGLIPLAGYAGRLLARHRRARRRRMIRRCLDGGPIEAAQLRDRLEAMGWRVGEGELYGVMEGLESEGKVRGWWEGENPPVRWYGLAEGLEAIQRREADHAG